MDIVYAGLRRRPGTTGTDSEAGEVTAVLWAHAALDDGLQHVSGRSEADRFDLLMYFLGATPDRSDVPTRARTLLARCYEASPAMQRRYLHPGDTSGERTICCGATT